MLLEKRPKNVPKLAKVQNWLKTHPRVVNAQMKHVIQHFGGMLALKWSANICCGQISKDVQRSTVSNYQKTCKDLLWANIIRRAKICCGQVSGDMRISLSKYQQMGKDHFGKYQRAWKYLWANISRCAKIFCQVSAEVRRSFGKYQKMCIDLWANISRCAKIFWQISAKVRRYAQGKYQQTCEYILANIRWHA